MKYPGGKSYLALFIKQLWELSNSRRFTEPFVGSLAVPLCVDPGAALINDINEHAINLHRHVKDGLVITQDFKNEEEYYYQSRVRFNELVRTGRHNTKEAAELYFYMNRNGFNGLSRFNKKGEFNVPFGRYNTVNYQKEFASYSMAMTSWEIKCGDFEALEIKDDDFIYADPPYDETFTGYSEDGFTWKDQERLVNWLSGHSGPVVTTNSATNRVLQLYANSGFNVYTFSAPRRISANGNRAKALEMFAVKNLALPSTSLARLPSNFEKFSSSVAV